VVFVVTAPLAHFLRTSFVPHVEFPSYTKAELVKILSAEPCEPLPGVSAQDLAELQIRFLGAVHDAVVKPAARTLPAFKEACTALWPKFTAPIVAGSHGAREFSKLLVAARMHLQNESFLDPPLVAPLEPKVALLQAKTASKPASKSLAAELALLLPTTARLLLVAAYLASHNATRHDLTLFSTFHHGRKRRGGGGLSVPGAGNSRRGPRSKHRKIARKLLGAHAFVLERMLAIFAAVQAEWDGRPATAAVHLDADVGMALATLARLRLLVRVGTAGDLLDRSGKWRVNVGWELVKGLGRSMGIEVEEWLVE
jgi:origin recognition complex subunit 5